MANAPERTSVRLVEAPLPVQPPEQAAPEKLTDAQQAALYFARKRRRTAHNGE